LRQAIAGTLPRVDVDLHRQTHLQRMVAKLLRVERDAHRSHFAG